MIFLIFVAGVPRDVITLNAIHLVSSQLNELAKRQINAENMHGIVANAMTSLPTQIVDKLMANFNVSMFSYFIYQHLQQTLRSRVSCQFQKKILPSSASN